MATTISAEEHDQQQRLVDGLAHAGAEAVDEEQPDVERHRARRARRRSTGGRKSGLKSVVSGPTTRSGTSATRNFSASSGSGFSISGLVPSAAASTPERAQLLLDQELDVAGADLAAEPLGHGGGDLGVVAPAVGLAGHEVEQVGELDHLAVGAAGDVGSLLEAGALVLADQLDALGQPGRRPARAPTPSRARRRCSCCWGGSTTEVMAAKGGGRGEPPPSSGLDRS